MIVCVVGVVLNGVDSTGVVFICPIDQHYHNAM